MNIIKFIILLIFFITICNSSYSQDAYSNNSNKYNVEFIDKDILYSRVTLTDKDGNYYKGFLVDLKSDSLVLLDMNERKNIPIKDLISLTFETRKKGGMRGVAIGGILGTYLFYVAAWQAKDEPFAYYENESWGGQALVSFLGTLLGSGVGYIIDISTEESTEKFDFSGTANDKIEELQRLKKYLVGNESSSKLHLYFQLSQVSTRLSESENNVNNYSYQHRDITSFNLVRKIQLTYSFLDELEIGGAVSWFGEPSVGWYPLNSSVTSEFSSGKHSYEGYGFYAIAVYNPFNSIFPKSFAWKLGAGVGTGNVDYKFTASRYSYYFEADTTINSINKSLFSAMFFTQFELFLYNSFSMGFIADYIYLSEEMPGIPELEISSRKMGNFSFGLTLGLHF